MTGHEEVVLALRRLRRKYRRSASGSGCTTAGISTEIKEQGFVASASVGYKPFHKKLEHPRHYYKHTEVLYEASISIYDTADKELAWRNCNFTRESMQWTGEFLTGVEFIQSLAFEKMYWKAYSDAMKTREEALVRALTVRGIVPSIG